jgi:hypothetical protein
MKRILLFISFAMAVCFCAMTSQAQAQATRTWVSGVGDDANPCSRTAPCKTFAGAISKTADCGEIDALDPGGYGTVTLTKGIKIDGGGGESGQVASILASGVPGVTVNNSSVTCPFDVLRNLDIQGIKSGTKGINMIAGGTLALENVDIENFTQQCVDFEASGAKTLTAYNVNLENCNGGELVAANVAGGGQQRVTMTGVKFSKSTAGLGVQIGANVKASLSNCSIDSNSTGGVLVTGVGAQLMLQHCQITNNTGYGVQATAGGNVFMADNSVTHNGAQGLFPNGGTIQTWNNNWVIDNNPDGARSNTVPPQ